MGIFLSFSSRKCVSHKVLSDLEVAQQTAVALQSTLFAKNVHFIMPVSIKNDVLHVLILGYTIIGTR